jgi:hypothetical protein
MPIVVDEVVISVEVANGAGAPGGEGGGGASAPSSTQGKQQLLQECVERVLEILRQREER